MHKVISSSVIELIMSKTADNSMAAVAEAVATLLQKLPERFASL